MTSPYGLATAKGPVMADVIAERVRRYILDGSDEDLRRLSIAEISQEMARAAFRRVGMQEGWHAIDCGCGPIGGLAVMAGMVGPAGRVVGVDLSEPTIRRARSVLAALQLGNVKVVAGDIHELGGAALGGPFDLAYTRLFLMHQPDPVRTARSRACSARAAGWWRKRRCAPRPRDPTPPRCPRHLLGSRVRAGRTGRGCAAWRCRRPRGVGACGGSCGYCQRGNPAPHRPPARLSPASLPRPASAREGVGYQTRTGN
jgi:Methyltransferase domain